MGKESTMSTVITTIAEAKKVLTDDQIVKAVNAYLHNKEYHKIKNAKDREMIKKAKAAGITV